MFSLCTIWCFVQAIFRYLLSIFIHIWWQILSNRNIVMGPHSSKQGAFARVYFATSCRFIQSFNRANLKFVVYQKRLKSCTKEIIELIKMRFPRLSGIVYCLSRNECDTLAKELTDAGLPARSYHAGMTDAARKQIQEAWIQEDNFKVRYYLLRITPRFNFMILYSARPSGFHVNYLKIW